MSVTTDKAFSYLVMVAVAIAVATPQGRPFSFAGLSLASDLDQVAARYAHSNRAGSYIHVAPEDSHDHISGIEISGSGVTRRVRVAFEIRRNGGRPVFPTCARIQVQIERKFGRPSSVRTFSEESSRRADRIWRARNEVLTLICFGGSRGQWLAEAVQINAVADRQ